MNEIYISARVRNEGSRIAAGLPKNVRKKQWMRRSRNTAG
jgi:hypothetical protein